MSSSMSSSTSAAGVAPFLKSLKVISIKTLCLVTACFLGYSTASAQTRAWGYNFYGQIGDGTSGSANKRPTPIDINLNSVTQISGSGQTTLALKADGTVLAWGSNQYGQSGNGTFGTITPTPVAVSSLTNIIAVSAGSDHSVALRADGTVWVWGNNVYGQLGNNNGFDPVPVPIQVPVISDIVAIETGSDNTYALKSDGTVWSWGGNDFGQSGTPDSLDVRPRQVGSPNNILTDMIAIAGGGAHGVALKKDGTVWSWGFNGYGEMGNGTGGGQFEKTIIPVQANITGVTQIASGGNHTVVLKADGTVWAWGMNHRGQIGNGTTNGTGGCFFCVRTPQRSSVTNAVDIETMGDFTLARKTDGSILAWGSNEAGSLGNGQSGVNVFEPTPVQSLVGAGNAIFSAGAGHGFAAVPVIATPVGANVFIPGDNFNVKFSSVTIAGTTTIAGIDAAATGLIVPGNLTVLPNAAAYNLTSTAATTGGVQVCLGTTAVFNLAQFNRLRLLHGEGAAFIDRTTTRNYRKREICAETTALGQYVIAEAATLAATATITGRVLSPTGRGIPNARVTISGSGVNRTVQTNPFGFYRLTEVAAGQSYLVTVSAKRYLFTARKVDIGGDTVNLNFTAEP